MRIWKSIHNFFFYPSLTFSSSSSLSFTHTTPNLYYSIEILTNRDHSNFSFSLFMLIYSYHICQSIMTKSMLLE